MSNLAKVAIPTIAVFALYIFYLSLPTGELGSFDAVRSAGEINQNINVHIVNEKGFSRDASNKIISFIARDRYNQEAVINLKNPASNELINAEIIELFGHMHQNTFIAAAATIVR